MKLNLSVKKIKSYIQLIRPLTAMLGIMGVFVGGTLSGFNMISIELFYAMVVVFFMVAGSMSFNDYFDCKIDKISHPHRPIPSGNISPREALYFSYVSFFVALVLSWIINVFSFMIVVSGIDLLVLYEKFFKNIGLLGNIVAAFISGLALVFGGAAVGHYHNAILLACMTFVLMLGREILKDVQDVTGEVLNRKTLPMQIGRRNALYVGCFFVFMTIVLVPLPYLLHILNFWYGVIIIPASILFAYSILLVLKDLKNIGITIEILRSGSAFALLGFIVGVL